MTSSRDGRLAATGILFDLDGTLIDSRVPVVRSLNHALAAHGRPERAEEELVPWIGAPIHDIVRGIFGDGTGEDEVDAGVASFRDRYAVKSLVETAVQPGIADLLPRLAERARLVVATTKPQPHAIKLVQSLGLAPHFGAVVGPSLEARSEKKAVTLARALTELPDDGHRVLVGDTAWDVEAARANEMPVVGVTWGVASGDELRAAGATVIVDTADELDAVLA